MCLSWITLSVVDLGSTKVKHLATPAPLHRTIFFSVEWVFSEKIESPTWNARSATTVMKTPCEQGFTSVTNTDITNVYDFKHKTRINHRVTNDSVQPSTARLRLIEQHIRRTQLSTTDSLLSRTNNNNKQTNTAGIYVRNQRYGTSTTQCGMKLSPWSTDKSNTHTHTHAHTHTHTHTQSVFDNKSFLPYLKVPLLCDRNQRIIKYQRSHCNISKRRGKSQMILLISMAELTFKTHPHQVKANAKAKILFDVWYFTFDVFDLFFDFFAFTIAFARVNGSLLWNLKNPKQRQMYA